MNKKFLQSVVAGVFGLSLVASCSHFESKTESHSCATKKKEEAHKCSAAKKNEAHKCSSAKKSEAKKAKAAKEVVKTEENKK